MLHALIFDVDGTLADTERNGHRLAFNRAFAEAGLDWVWDETFYGGLLEVAGGKERIRHFISAHLKQPPVPAEKVENLVADLYQAKALHYRELLSSGRICPRTGVKRLIREARDAGLRLAIATTSQPDSVRALLDGSFAPIRQDWFEAVIAGDMVANKKPAPDVYHQVLRKLNVRPAECLAIEDSRQGLEAALGADIATLVTTNPYTVDQEFPGALAVLDHLGDPDDLVHAPKLWNGPGMVTVEQLICWRVEPGRDRAGGQTLRPSTSP